MFGLGKKRVKLLAPVSGTVVPLDQVPDPVFAKRMVGDGFSIDPLTGELPEDPLAGFLPPNDETGRGESRITFEIDPRPGLADGTTITNQAEIVFDTETPIVTIQRRSGRSR